MTVRYCQRCVPAVALLPRDGTAACPGCGYAEPARRLPLFVVTGASGAGKSAVCADLAAALPECLVFDVDWLIDPFTRAGTPVDWPALFEAWLVVAHGAAQGGRHTVLLGPLTPDKLDVPARRWVGAIHFALLDCPDGARRQRLAARPSWRAADAERQLAFAAYLRRVVPTVVATDGGPADAAAELAAWVRRLL